MFSNVQFLNKYIETHVINWYSCSYMNTISLQSFKCEQLDRKGIIIESLTNNHVLDAISIGISSWFSMILG